LEILATHPDFRRKGLASRLMEWGTQKADEKGVEMYLDSSKMGRPLYEKFGWIAHEEFMDEKAISVPMLRPKKE
jgi:GNAT superfamily N-acetyltransferase